MLFRVTRIEQTAADCLVEADSLEKAKEIAQMDHVHWGKDEVIDGDITGDEAEADEDKGRYVFTHDGYFEPNKQKVTL